MNHEKALLELKNLKKYYTVGGSGRNAKQLKAVDDVSMTLYEGEICGVVGESGCGKSTLGRSVLRLHPLSGGEVIYKGKHLEGLSMKEMRPLRKKMQMIFQDPYASLNPRMSIYQSVKAPLDVLESMPESEKRDRILAILKLVSVPEQHLTKYPHELSGGQRQRIVIARAMITNPKFVVCDEPVSALDVSVRAQILNLMKRVQAETGVSYMFISHDLSVVKYLCDSIVVMYLGKVVEIAWKKDLFENPLHPYTNALMSAIPVPDIHVKKKRIILCGDIPSPVSPPSGCCFHTRCPYATELCSKQAPQLTAVGNGHAVACHYAGQFEKYNLETSEN